MIKIASVMIICVILAYYSQRYTEDVERRGQYYSVLNDHAFLLLAMVLVLFAGLRKDYNDTWNYIDGFRKAPGITAFLADPENLDLMKNPMFEFYRNALRSMTDNAQIMIFIPAAFTQICYLRFFKRYSDNFTLSVFIYFALGTINVSLAALKQVWAMAIATLAFPCLEKKQWIRYYLILFVAMLFHTYVIAFAVLPLFMQKPWKLFTYLFMAGLVFVMLNFESTISAFMEQAEDMGKKVYAEDVFHEHGVNPLRVAVYAVTPVISFLFRKWIFRESSPVQNVLVHMSIISFAFMLMGTQSGANLFARMSQYFEIGTVCCLPSMLKKPFNERSYRLVSRLSAACFLAYFIYANGINGRFDDAYNANNILSLLGY